MQEVDLWYLIAAQFIATMGGVVVVFIVDLVYNMIFKTREKIALLREEVSFTLTNEAQYFCNPGSINYYSEIQKEEYRNSSHTMRELASKLLAFSEVHKCTFYKISSKDISNAGSNLLFISNSYYNKDYASVNYEKGKKVRKLLLLDKKEK